MSNNLRSSSHTRAALEIICEEEEEEKEEEEKVFSPIILSPFSLLAAAEAIFSSLPISSSLFSPDEFVRGSPLHPPSTSHHLSCWQRRRKKMSKMRIGGRRTSFAFAPSSTLGKGRGRRGEEEIRQGYLRIFQANKKKRKQRSVLKIKRLLFLFFFYRKIRGHVS